MASSLAAGRAIVGYLSPPERTAEFFGLWGLAVKAASIFGPLTYGAVTWIFEGNHRLAFSPSASILSWDWSCSLELTSSVDDGPR